jgi:hypothetical protein
VSIQNGGVGILNGGTVDLKESGVGIIRAGKVTADQIKTVFLLTDQVNGEVSTVFDKKSSAILGAIFAATLVFLAILKHVFPKKESK